MDELEQIVNQSEAEKAEETAVEFQLATIGSVTENGITLQFDGADSASEKEYKCNPSALFKAGDRVKITKDSGSYIVDFPLGTPMERYPIPSGGEEGNLLAKGTDERSVIWLDQNTYVTFPSGGSSGKVLGYDSSDGVKWVDGIPTTGTTGYFLQKTATGTEWAAAATFPTSGTTGYFLQKTSTGTQWASAATFPTSGSTGQYLQKTSTGTQWATVSTYSGPTINGTGTTSIGFFGHTAHIKTNVSTVLTTATLTQVITALNNLINALDGYGLV